MAVLEAVQANHGVQGQNGEAAMAWRLFEEFMLTPGLGAHSKREIEIKFVDLLFGESLESVTVAQAADRLALPRARARSILLETRVRRASLEPDEQVRARARKQRVRRAIFRESLEPGRVEIDSNRFRLSVDDPQVQDDIQNLAASSDIVIDGSFSSEVVSLKWESWIALAGACGADDILDKRSKKLKAQLKQALQARDDKNAMKLATGAKFTSKELVTYALRFAPAAAKILLTGPIDQMSDAFEACLDDIPDLFTEAIEKASVAAR